MKDGLVDVLIAGGGPSGLQAALSRGDFRAEAVRARRVLLATGLIDHLPELEGLAPLWGHSVFQCPYCHGWEARERRWGTTPRMRPTRTSVS